MNSLHGRKLNHPRGKKTSLPHGGLPEVISPFLQRLIRKTGGKNGPIGRQFIAQPKKERRFSLKDNLDPLLEDEHEVVAGLVYKYRGEVKSKGKIKIYGRVLWTITSICSSYCRFCTRGRFVGYGFAENKPLLTDDEIKKALEYLKNHREINEVIISGGDPLTANKNYLEKIILPLTLMQARGQIDIIRIGTRVPIVNPSLLKDWHFRLLKKIKNPYLMVHINHPAELNKKSLAVLNRFRKKSLATILSQTVLLRGVNDRLDVLLELFNLMAKEGIRPYYVYQNDPIPWAKHFTVPINRAISLWQKIRPRLSGLSATARFVIDSPLGYGKISLPEGNFWNVDYRFYRDFKNHKFQTDKKGPLTNK